MQLLSPEHGVGHQADFQSGRDLCKDKNSPNFPSRGTLGQIRLVKMHSFFRAINTVMWQIIHRTVRIRGVRSKLKLGGALAFRGTFS